MLHDSLAEKNTEEVVERLHHGANSSPAGSGVGAMDNI